MLVASNSSTFYYRIWDHLQEVRCLTILMAWPASVYVTTDI